MLKMPKILEYTRPDEIAETWESINEESYYELWGFMRNVGPYPSEFPDCPDHGNAAQFWNKMSEELKKNIIDSNAAMKEWEKYALD